MSTNVKTENRGGKRPKSGRKKILIKPEKNMGIFIKESVFKQLNLQKKQQNAKSWNAFFVDILGTK